MVQIAKRKSNQLGLGVQAFLVYAVSGLLGAYYQFLTPFLPETDGHYHITVAALMRSHGVFRNGFPWTEFSLWTQNFSDSCFLFHIFLMPFTFFHDLAFGAKLAVVVLHAALFTSFFLILKLNRVRFPVFWWATLLVIGGDFFFWRMSVPRPQILSVILMLWSIHCLINERLRAFAALCFLYPYAYVAGFLPVGFAILYAVHVRWSEQRNVWNLAGYGWIACLASYVLHPYFPKNLLMFWVQNFYVMWVAVIGGVRLNLGGEFYPVNSRVFLFTGLPVVTAVVSCLYFALSSGKRLSRKTVALGIPALCFVLMSMITKRFVEYATPFALMWAALGFSDLLKERSFKSWLMASPKARSFLIATVALLWVICAHRNVTLNRHQMLGVVESSFKDAALYLKSVMKPGEVIFTCDWDDAPELFFYNQDQHYLVMMDPTFMYFWNPDLYATWTQVANGLLGPKRTFEVMRDDFRARYGVCTSEYRHFRSVLQTSSDFEIVVENESHFIFRRK